MLLAVVEKIVDAYFALRPRAKPTPESMQAARLIAHRGAHNHAQGVLENTLAAFRLAKQLGCWGIELDVQITADQVLVVHHDPSLNRLWGRDLLIAELNFSDLRTQVPQIPTLAEVVREFGQQLHLFIELKSMLPQEQSLVAILQALRAGEDFHLLSLDAAILHALNQFPRQALLLVAAHDNVSRFCSLSLQEHYAGVLGHYLLMTDNIVTRLQAANQLIGVGFVDSKYGLYRELNRGIHWLFSNRVTEISPYLN